MACDISPVASRRDASDGAEQRSVATILQRKTCDSVMTYQLRAPINYPKAKALLYFVPKSNSVRWPRRGELGNQHSRSAWTTTTGATSSRQTKATTGTPISPQHPPALVHLPPCSLLSLARAIWNSPRDELEPHEQVHTPKPAPVRT